MRAIVVAAVALTAPAAAEPTLATSTAATADVVVEAPPPAPLVNAIAVAIPSLDGARGLQVAYERFLPDRRISLAATVQLHESAIGDYTGLRAGAGAELRWYWRARSFLRAQPTGSMIGWFTGGRIDIAGAWTHDVADHRWLGTGLSLGATAEIGYRIAPWRTLAITPSAGLAARRDYDLSGRLPSWGRGAFAFGLDVGWLF